MDKAGAGSSSSIYSHRKLKLEKMMIKEKMEEY
jgi:hypothetical protein